MRLDDHVAAELGVGREEHGVGRDHGHAGFQRGGPQALLQHSFGLGELRPRVDSAHVVLLGFQCRRRKPQRIGDLDRVRQIELALRIAIVDPIENAQRRSAVEGHDAAVAKSDGALRFVCILVLADVGEPVILHDQPPIAGRIGRPEAEHRDGGAVRDGVPQLGKRCGGHKGRIAEDDQDLIGPAPQCLAGAQRRMRGPATLGLDEHVSVRHDPLHLSGRVLLARADHHGSGGRAGGCDRRQHVGQQRAAADRVHDLRVPRAHAGALAGREHDRQAGSCVHEISADPSPNLRPHSRAERGTEGRREILSAAAGLGALCYCECAVIRRRRQGSRSDPFEQEEDRFRRPPAAPWGLGAALAVITVGAAAQSETVARRMAAAFNRLPTAWRPAVQNPAGGEPQPVRTVAAGPEARRLADTIRLLSAERHRLAARLDALGRSPAVTGSVPAQPAGPRFTQSRNASAITEPQPASGPSQTAVARATPDRRPVGKRRRGGAAMREPHKRACALSPGNLRRPAAGIAVMPTLRRASLAE